MGFKVQITCSFDFCLLLYIVITALKCMEQYQNNKDFIKSPLKKINRQNIECNKSVVISMTVTENSLWPWYHRNLYLIKIQILIMLNAMDSVKS